MPTFRHGSMELIYDSTNLTQQILASGIDAASVMQGYLSPVQAARNVVLPVSAKNFADQVLDLIGTAANQAGLNPFVSTSAADKFFGYFTGLWIALYQGGFQLAASDVWKQVLSWTDAYESSRRRHIHKGTALFFLGRNLLEQGDIDAGFHHVYSAMEEDKDAWNLIGQPQRYKQSPAYMTVTVVDNVNNALHDLVVEPIRDSITQSASSFSLATGSSFTVQNFETQFLSKANLEEVVFFFVYNMYNHVVRNRFGRSVRKNDFIRLRNLDSFFNLCLVIEEALKEQFAQGRSPYYISDGICELASSRGWILHGEDKNGFLRKLRNIDLSSTSTPSSTIPALLAGNPLYNNQPVRREIKFLLLAWHLRNYGGHNIRAQDILVQMYDEIFEWLIYSLFLSVM